MRSVRRYWRQVFHVQVAGVAVLLEGNKSLEDGLLEGVGKCKFPVHGATMLLMGALNLAARRHPDSK